MKQIGEKTAVIGLICALTVAVLPFSSSAGETASDEIRSTGPCMGEEGFSDAWLDRTHVYLNRILCQPSVWFDNFFGEQRVGDEWPGSLVSWKNSYRLGYAEASSHTDWVRMDEKAGIECSESGWDSTMQAYPSVVDTKTDRYLFYNGNGFGAAGFGCAVWE